ncbi:MAG: tetratricopeptide repeat protein [Xanthobacteraceae bacterium]
MRAGLLPLLDAETVGAGGREWLWREMRPGDDPLRRLTYLISSLAEDTDPIIASARQDRIAAHLRRSSFGVAEALGEIDGMTAPSIMLVIDQFEELFRYATGKGAGTGDQTRARDEAVQFVQLLLEATRTRTHKVHVLLTMRSDFIGDCARFYGLPEAVSGTQFLVPALTRDQMEEVIREPIEKAGATIAPDLVERLLNDCSNEPDQLPVLQHCLLRLWEEAGQAPEPATPVQPDAVAAGNETATHPTRILTVDHYQRIGGFANALSQHANEILKDLPGARLQLAVEQTFCALSELDKEGRAIRRALPFSQLLAETGVGEQDLRRVLDRFRADDCSFLVPPPYEQPVIAQATRIDVGHEAFLRRWEKTSGRGAEIGWLRAEQLDGERYRALLAMAESENATLPPHLVDERWAWWTSRRRTPAWAERYGGGFDRVQHLLVASRRLQARRRWTRVAAFAGAVVAAVVMFGLWQHAENQKQQVEIEKQRAEIQKQQAEIQKQRAEKSHGTALQAILESVGRLQVYLNDGTITVRGAEELLQDAQETLADLTADGQDQDRKTLETGTRLLLTMSDVRVALGQDEDALNLARRAKAIIAPLLIQNPKDQDLLHLDYASLFRMADANAAQSHNSEAVRDYEAALAIAQELADRNPGDLERQRNLAFIINKIGDTHQINRRWAAAIREYQKSLEIVQQQAAKDPEDTEWRRNVAVSKSRIGQVLEGLRDYPGALGEYREALSIQKELSEKHPDNNILWTNQATTYRRIGGSLKYQERYDEAQTAYESAVEIREKLHNKDPGNASWRKALATDLAYVGDVQMLKKNWAGAANIYRQAVQIREDLAFREPRNNDLKADLAIAHEKIGAALREQQEEQQLDEALSHYEQVVGLYRELISAGWKRQTNLFDGHLAIGDVHLKQGNNEEALIAYREGLALAEEVAAQGAGGTTAAWRIRISSAHERIGDALAADQANQAERRASYQKALAAAAAVRAQEPDNKQAQRQTASVEAKLRNLDQASELPNPDESSKSDESLNPETSLNPARP